MLTVTVAAAIELGLDIVLATTPFRVAPFGSDAVLRAIYRRNRALYELGLERRIEFCQAVRDVAATTGVPLVDGEAYLRGAPEWQIA